MSNWSLNIAKAKQAQQQVEQCSAEIRKLLERYNTARQELLNSWEGGHKDDFVAQTNNGFEVTAAQLVKSVSALASSIGTVSADMVRRDETAASILGGK